MQALFSKGHITNNLQNVFVLCAIHLYLKCPFKSIKSIVLVPCTYAFRGAEAGGILGVNTPHFFGLTSPTFWIAPKTEVREGGNKKLGAGVGKGLGGKKIF